MLLYQWTLNIFLLSFVDTSFMYIIACLCMLKIYQTRHPDISAKAHTSYLLMACVIFIAVIGVVRIFVTYKSI